MWLVASHNPNTCQLVFIIIQCLATKSHFGTTAAKYDFNNQHVNGAFLHVTINSLNIPTCGFRAGTCDDHVSTWGYHSPMCDYHVPTCGYHWDSPVWAALVAKAHWDAVWHTTSRQLRCFMFSFAAYFWVFSWFFLAAVSFLFGEAWEPKWNPFALVSVGLVAALFVLCTEPCT